MAPASTVTLKRWRVYAKPRALSPYRREGGESVTNAKRVRVRRMSGRSQALALKPLHGYASLLNADELAFVQRIAKRRAWVLTVESNDLTIPRYSFLDGDTDCNADLLAALNRVGKRLNRVVFIRSGRRTMAEQTALFKKYGSPRAAYPQPSAPHIRGVAADCGIDGFDIGDVPGAVAAMKAEGVGLRVPGEDWHCELTDSMVGAD